MSDSTRPRAASSVGRTPSTQRLARHQERPAHHLAGTDLAVTSFGLAPTTERTRLRLPDDLPLSAWSRIGDQILRLSDSSSWWIGDWLVFGQEKYRDRYKHAMAETSLDYQTLRNYAWVARRFAPARRRPDLTFQHHMEVAALSEQEQDHWLDFARRLNWSRNELRKQVRASVDDRQDDEPSREVRLQLQISPERMERWETAAARLNCALGDWMAQVLDHAVQDPPLEPSNAPAR